MADLLSSLAAANSSHESFHSTHSSLAAATINQKGPDVHTAALQAAGLPVYDVDAYLNDPKNQSLLHDLIATKKGKASTSRQDSCTGSGSSSTEPVQLGGPKTSHYVKVLYELCQSRGLQPEFEIDGDESGFGGWISINGETIGTDEKWRSKKEAKEGLAQKGIDLASRVAQNARPTPAAAAGPRENWIGKLLGEELLERAGPDYLFSRRVCHRTPDGHRCLLGSHGAYADFIGLSLEYHNATSPTQGPIYTDFAVGKLFACTCTIPGNPTAFGGTSSTFPSKKAARMNAAREAMQSLITAGLAEADGSLKVKKKAKLGTAVKVEEHGLGVKKNTTFAQRVNGDFRVLAICWFTPSLTFVVRSLPNPRAYRSDVPHQSALASRAEHCERRSDLSSKPFVPKASR